MHISWQDYQVFMAVAESGSFSEASRQLRLTQPTVSRRIAALEAQLGRSLFRRDSEGAHLTEDGQRLRPAAEQMARWAGEMARAAASWERTPEGVVRCASAPGMAFELLVPLAAQLQQRWPSLRMDLLTGIEHIDLTRGDADLALRTRPPTQPELTVLATWHVTLGVFVAPSLRARLGPEPLRPTELPWVTWCAPMAHVTPRPELEAAIEPLHIGFASNDYLTQRRAVELGLGAFILPRVTHPEMPWNDLIEISVDLPLPRSAPIHLVCARSMQQVPRVKAVVDGMLELMDLAEGATLELPA